MTRVKIPQDMSTKILVECHYRCCLCPEHSRIANIHHIDKNHSNNQYDNLVAVREKCHSDLHSKFEMRRNITPEQIGVFKQKWTEQCSNLEEYLRYNDSFVNQFYYINVHRLETIFKSITGKSMITKMPYKYSNSKGSYNSLWNNPKNSLNWTQLLENRSYLDDAVKTVMSNMSTYNLALIELGALDATELRGEIVHFSCQFIGRDIPDQTELVDASGMIEGPQGTMRREILDKLNDVIFEICMLIDPLYMYSDSAFIQFSENGFWNGIALVGQLRDGIGSNDGHLLRKQLILTPICIGSPNKLLVSSKIRAKGAILEDYELLQLTS
ncbi:hypothetical protein Dtox_3809 [Desulfofarcimen acetoxidans DSM 771]|uniref:HNH nuclease domain-containing protein n=1 Tax=Desulfofarcimen acetoxidans (strain ATCC 49208 / DSM 771 / KCTC 5769 / VKM B-1644 / 5575) TaxID=485916 RepID=C8VXB8_DESAS|nr:HNH endonuclease signature motif containing protein [Desulfofarcimen acetoxidans]ACV64514.1 hypothetical protein Dtox_3809 [Desulfofarcimen acetoxidans DSM 771]